MNRALRRAAAHAKPMPPAKVRKVPKLFDEFEQFDDVDRFMQKLINGQIEEQAGHIIMTSNRGKVYRALPALEGWIEYWRTLADKHGINYDDEPMRKLLKRLDVGMPLSEADIHHCMQVIQQQRRMFNTLPRNVISSMANTVQIKILMEEKAE